MAGFIELTPTDPNIPRFTFNKDFIVYAHEDRNGLGGTVLHLREDESWNLHVGAIGSLHVGEIGSQRISVKEDYETVRGLLTAG